MKFKVMKSQLELILKQCSDKDTFAEIEMTPVWETAREAIRFEEEIKRQSFQKGYDYGYREGWHDRNRCPSFYHKDRMCNCRCL